MITLSAENLPDTLKALPQWVVWRRVQRGAKTTKVPHNARTGRRASTTDPTTWSTFEEALQATSRFDGIGFVFTEEGNLTGVDLDHCIDEDGELEPHAQQVVTNLSSYAEISPSGRGVHVIVEGNLPAGSTRRRKGGIEMYDSARFFCMTGALLPGAPTIVEQRTQELDSLYADVFGKPPCHSETVQPTAVAELVRRIEREPESRLGRLWCGEVGDYPSRSEADLALCSLLASRCESDPVRVDRLFRRSGLMRPKWDELRGNETYGERTVQKACSHSATRSVPKPVSLLALPHTDYGNAQRLVRRYGAKLRHAYAMNRWYVWDRRRWRADDTGEVIRYAKETTRHLAKLALKQGDNEALVNFARAAENRARIEATVALARSEPEVVVTPDQLDADPWLFNVRNGTIDLRTGDLRAHRPEDLITQLAPVEYENSATCPTFDRFLDQITSGREDIASFLQQLFGMALTGDVSEQILIVFHGDGANGKSTLLDLIMFIMGSYATIASPELLIARKWSQHPTEVADLWGRRLVVSIETERGQTLRSSFIKSITGDARLKGRFMRQDFFEFDRTFMTILCTNNKPTVPEQSHAIWRRLRLVPFEYIVLESDQDKHLLAKLKSEASGVLAWAVQGCLSWRRNGLATPPDVLAATDEYRSEQDHHQRFADECLTLVDEAWSRSSEIVNAYESWCRQAGLEADLPGLWERLKRWGCERRRTSGERRWRGVGVIFDIEEEPT